MEFIIYNFVDMLVGWYIQNLKERGKEMKNTAPNLIIRGEP